MYNEIELYYLKEDGQRVEDMNTFVIEGSLVF